MNRFDGGVVGDAGIGEVEIHVLGSSRGLNKFLKLLIEAKKR